MKQRRTPGSYGDCGKSLSNRVRVYSHRYTLQVNNIKYQENCQEKSEEIDEKRLYCEAFYPAGAKAEGDAPNS